MTTTTTMTQARERTQILMDLANQVGGFVIGTGDLSEAALGWCTFNGDHMSMYHVNAGIPKTLVRYLIDWCADTEFSGATGKVLHDIAATPISPELLPVNYVSHEGALWIRTTAHSSIAEQADESPVAIEVDTIDPATHVGWSVVVRGRAEAFYHEDQIPAEVRSLRSWPAGSRPLWIQVTPEQLTGRRLLDD